MISTALVRANRIAPPSTRSGRPTAGRPPRFQFVQATRWPDVRGAFGLLYRNYLERGLIRPDPAELRFTVHNLLPESATFAAKVPGRVVATFSVIPDTPSLGLPMDTLYAAELARLRARGRRPAEVSGLAVDPAFRPLSLLLILNLVRMLHAYAQATGVTDLVVACHPRHARLYERLFLFDPFGPLRTYRAVNDAPAVALRLDLTCVRDRYLGAHGDACLYRFFFVDRVFSRPRTALRAGAMTKAACRRLLSLRPEFLELLEDKAPEVLERITGWSPRGGRPKQLVLPFPTPAGPAPGFLPA